MKLLLDTCGFLWLATEPKRLSKAAAEALDDDTNERWLSDVSLWEISLKHSAGKLPLPEPPREWIPKQTEFFDLQPLHIDSEASVVFAIMDLVLVLDLADVGNVRQQVPQAILVERPAAALNSILRCPLFCLPVAAIEFLDDWQQSFEFEIQLEDRPNHLGLVGIGAEKDDSHQNPARWAEWVLFYSLRQGTSASFYTVPSFRWALSSRRSILGHLRLRSL